MTVNSDHPMIVPHDDLYVAVFWYGGVTFNVHVLDPHFGSYEIGHEVDVFTAYGASSERPTMHEAYRHIVNWFDAQEQAMREEE